MWIPWQSGHSPKGRTSWPPSFRALARGYGGRQQTPMSVGGLELATWAFVTTPGTRLALSLGYGGMQFNKSYAKIAAPLKPFRAQGLFTWKSGRALLVFSHTPSVSRGLLVKYTDWTDSNRQRPDPDNLNVLVICWPGKDGRGD